MVVVESRTRQWFGRGLAEAGSAIVAAKRGAASPHQLVGPRMPACLAARYQQSTTRPPPIRDSAPLEIAGGSPSRHGYCRLPLFSRENRVSLPSRNRCCGVDQFLRLVASFSSRSVIHSGDAGRESD